MSWLKAAVWNRPTLGNPRWAVTVRVDLSLGPGGLAALGNTRVFFGAAVNHTSGDVIVGNVAPKAAADEDSIGDTIIPHRSTQWVAYAESGTTCASRRLAGTAF